jgi:hypothetical protein
VPVTINLINMNVRLWTTESAGWTGLIARGTKELTEFISGDPLNAGVNWELISPNAGDAIISTSGELFPDGTTVLKAIFKASLTGDNR